MKINNLNIFKHAQEMLGLKQSDMMSPEASSVIQPVVNLTPGQTRICKVKGSSGQNATSSNLMTIPADRDCYITSVQMSFAADANATNQMMAVNALIDGVQSYLCYMQKLTLTASRGDISVSFPHPIKLDRGQNIAITSDTAVGNFVIRASISYYFEDGN